MKKRYVDTLMTTEVQCTHLVYISLYWESSVPRVVILAPPLPLSLYLYLHFEEKKINTKHCKKNILGKGWEF